MFKSWRVGSAFGIGIYVHATFLLLPAWVFLSNLGGGSLQTALYLVAFVVAVFGCIVLHELGHALMARRFGIPTLDITLYPIGGVARLQRMSEKPAEEFWIAVAGPAVNFVIAGMLAVVMLLSEPVPFFTHLLIANAFLGLFNLLPAFPMDGGRVLRAILASRLGRLRATEIAASVGAWMAILFALVGVVNGHLGLLLLALFVWLMGQQELAAVRAAAGVWSTSNTVEPVAPRQGFSGYTFDSQAGLWIEWRNGQPIHTFR